MVRAVGSGDRVYGIKSLSWYSGLSDCFFSFSFFFFFNFFTMVLFSQWCVPCGASLSCNTTVGSTRSHDKSYRDQLVSERGLDEKILRPVFQTTRQNLSGTLAK